MLRGTTPNIIAKNVTMTLTIKLTLINIYKLINIGLRNARYTLLLVILYIRANATIHISIDKVIIVT